MFPDSALPRHDYLLAAHNPSGPSKLLLSNRVDSHITTLWHIHFQLSQPSCVFYQARPANDVTLVKIAVAQSSSNQYQMYIS